MTKFKIIKYNILLISILLFVFACTPNKKILSFFFDGVPDSTKVENKSSLLVNNIDSNDLKNNLMARTKEQVFAHSPYKEKECENCHDKSTMGKYVEEQPTLCYQCHEDFSTKFAHLHGPVSGGFCTACHSPHVAKFEKMLLRTGQDLCTKCHSLEMVLKNENHADIGDMNCTECHNPHGGSDRFIFN